MEQTIDYAAYFGIDENEKEKNGATQLYAFYYRLNPSYIDSLFDVLCKNERNFEKRGKDFSMIEPVIASRYRSH